MAGGGLLALASAAAVVTAAVLLISQDQSGATAQCPPTPSWVQQAALQAEAAAPAGGTLQPDGDALGAVTGLAADAMRRVGWRVGVRFARFDASASLQGALANPAAHAGAFLLVVPGNGTLARRPQRLPFLALDPAAKNLAAALAPAVAALNAAAGALEAALKRRLFAFHLDEAALAGCAAGTGPCAVWEASSGRVFLDSGLAAKMALAGLATAAGDGSHAREAAGDAVLQAPSAGGGTSEGSGGLPALLAAFVERLAGQAADATGLLQGGKASLPALSGVFASAGAAAVALMVAGPIPLWWCIACPLVLGMLAPFVLNYGLTAAAEELCAQLQLPDQACTDLWWGAFALALMLSLGAAVPIVYVCRLPECGRHLGMAAAAGAAAVAHLAAS
ncbi:hypothetical protein C2E20_5704 [Micractinium conductrix]|uniref:Uncharacterized protein n=1 Tax=Micractinium conductrix TaxID=554055 RepID=A0A2P6VA37_9CHLO|nr:hypothetical protein C2E20_5704 [Micractinium conductrix]|eukprot:PSC70938.1 hypothetical protein C2E20_5704 [Micractinium conductrix]